MRSGPFTYLWLVIKTACRHSFHTAHSIILALIILAGFVTSVVPQVEVLVDLHGWQVAAAVLGGIIAVRPLLAPYWIWKNDQGRLAVLRDQVANKVQNEHRLAARTAALDDIAEEIAWAVNNLVNPKPHPANTADPEPAIAGSPQPILALAGSPTAAGSSP
jgi:phosphate/sulfate permease